MSAVAKLIKAISDIGLEVPPGHSLVVKSSLQTIATGDGLSEMFSGEESVLKVNYSKGLLKEGGILVGLVGELTGVSFADVATQDEAVDAAIRGMLTRNNLELTVGNQPIVNTPLSGITVVPTYKAVSTANGEAFAIHESEGGPYILPEAAIYAVKETQTCALPTTSSWVAPADINGYQLLLHFAFFAKF